MTTKKSILVCGGAGYIGSHLVKELLKEHYQVTVYDNLSAGHRKAVPVAAKFVKGDIRDRQALEALFSETNIDAVVHMCASIVVSESCTDPLGYFENNVSGTITLLQTMHKFGVKYFVFSSTAAVFGMPERIPIQEDDHKFCLNPYGDSKLMVEQILKRCDEAYGMKHMILRYFNACGADAGGELGEFHKPETHLIPLVLQVPLGKREHVKIFGTDYDTPDGTCVRDYVHVTDLATAHILGYSVKEIIEAARKVTKHDIPVVIAPRREGDAAVLIASSDKTQKVLKWKHKYTDVESIVKTAWDFYQKNPSLD